MFLKHENGMILYLVHSLINPGLQQMGRWKSDYEVCGDGSISIIHTSPGYVGVCYVHESTLQLSSEVLKEAILQHKRSLEEEKFSSLTQSQ